MVVDPCMGSVPFVSHSNKHTCILMFVSGSVSVSLCLCQCVLASFLQFVYVSHHNMCTNRVPLRQGASFIALHLVRRSCGFVCVFSR